MAQVERTPVMVLQELTQHKHYPLPIYDLVESQSGTHDNTFRIRVQVRDQYAIGVGKSKKEAKHLAAQILLEILTGRKHNFDPPKVVPKLASLAIGSQRNPIEQMKFYGFPQGMDQSKTAIAILNEMAQQNNYALPTYDLVFSRAGTHENQFQYKVVLQGLSAVGSGSSKKEAKHNASQNLLDLINKKGILQHGDVCKVNQSVPQQPEKKSVLQALTVKLNDSLVLGDNNGLCKTTKEEAKIDATEKWKQEACILNPEDLWKVNHPLPPETNLVFQQNVSNAVGILQELLIRRSYPPPNYELVHSKTGTHSNIFFYKVEVLDDCTIGSGSSQKEAKHDAAQKMLQLLANKRKPQPSANTPEIKTELDDKKCVTLDDAWKANKSLYDKININLPPVNEATTKTSVAILQELMAAQRKELPTYELVQSKSGTHENMFEYKVRADDEAAVGVGKSKKEAKHNAAQRLLDLLSDKGKYQSQTTHDYSPCLKLRSIDRISYPVSDVFPSLEPITVFNNTKLFASKEVLDRIMEVMPQLKADSQLQDMEITDRDMEAQEKYNLLFSPHKMNLNTGVCDFHKQFKNAMKDKEIPKEAIQKYFNEPRLETTLENLLNLFEYTYSLEEVEVDPIPISMLSINCDVPLSFMEMGSSINEARTKVLNKTFTVLEAFMLL